MKKTVSLSYLITQIEIDERDTLDKLRSFASDSSQWHFYHGQLVYIRRQLNWLRAELQTDRIITYTCQRCEKEMQVKETQYYGQKYCFDCRQG